MRYFVLILLLFVSQPALAVNHKGLALVEIRNAKTVLELTQIVHVTDEQVLFVNLDDFGNESFQVLFDGKSMRLVAPGTDLQIKNSPLKRALQLPLSQEEFLAILRFDKPEGFKSCEESGVIQWHKPKYKKLKILFENFGTIPKTNLPKEIRLEYKKNLFHLKWLEINPKIKS